MLTVKMIERNGHEQIQECASVAFTPARASHPDDNKPHDELVAFGCTGKGGAVDEHGVCRYTGGMIYVMNEKGATIAQYPLS